MFKDWAYIIQGFALRHAAFRPNWIATCSIDFSHCVLYVKNFFFNFESLEKAIEIIFPGKNWCDIDSDALEKWIRSRRLNNFVLVYFLFHQCAEKQ